MGLEGTKRNLLGVIKLGLDHVGMDLLGLFKVGKVRKIVCLVVMFSELDLGEFDFGRRRGSLECWNSKRNEGS